MSSAGSLGPPFSQMLLENYWTTSASRKIYARNSFLRLKLPLAASSINEWAESICREKIKEFFCSFEDIFPAEMMRNLRSLIHAHPMSMIQATEKMRIKINCRFEVYAA
jgi:hypothetical protein